MMLDAGLLVPCQMPWMLPCRMRRSTLARAYKSVSLHWLREKAVACRVIRTYSYGNRRANMQTRLARHYAGL